MSFPQVFTAPGERGNLKVRAAAGLLENIYVVVSTGGTLNDLTTVRLRELHVHRFQRERPVRGSKFTIRLHRKWLSAFTQKADQPS